MTRRLLLSIWLGFALSATFFYPLASALDSDPYYLQWQGMHSVEAAVALLGLTPILATLIYLVWSRTGRGATVALALIAAFPLLSLGAGLSRQLPVAEHLRVLWEIAAIRYAIPAGVALGFAAAFIARPALLDRWLRRVLLTLSPVGLVVVKTLLATAMHAGPMVTRDAVPSAPAGAGCPSVVAFLFDELSFSYLYEGTSIRADYPNIRAFAERATNYLDVRVPGERTLIAVPSFLAGRPYDAVRLEGNQLAYEAGSDRGQISAQDAGRLFTTARTAGFSPEVAGYYLSYCDLLGASVDLCRSFSFYNAAGVAEGRFNPWHAVATTLILWPRQFPLGLFKNPPYGALQRDIVARTREFAVRPLPSDRSVFRYVHFSIPHLPFVFGPDRYDPPFDPLRQRPDTAYANQVRYVDHLFGELLRDLGPSGALERTTVVLFGDHGFRSGGLEEDVRRVPFIVRRPGQTTRTDVAERIGGEVLLHRLAACQP
jgi:hypothetical protein